MSYLTVIPLADAKTYLRIDDTLTEDDNQITRMIGAALSFVETWTNIMVYARDKTYVMTDGYLTNYDYPINSILEPLEDTYTTEKKTLYTNYCYRYISTVDMIANVGYADPLDVPYELIEVAYEIIDLMYYGEGKSKSVAKNLSMLSIEILNKNKRFLI